MPVYFTYQRGYLKGTRPFFAVAKRVISPLRVEGALLPPSASQEQSKGKEPVQDEGPLGEQETEFVLLHDDEPDAEPTNEELIEIIKEQQSEIEDLTIDLERAKWNMNYLEWRKK